MATCANCTQDAAYNYQGIKYCDSHLPKFLRDRNGKPTGAVSALPRSVVTTKLFPELVPVFPEAGVSTPVTEFVEEKAAAPVAVTPATVARKKKSNAKAK